MSSEKLDNRLDFRISSPMKERLQKEAAKEHSSVGRLIRNFINRCLILKARRKS